MMTYNFMGSGEDLILCITRNIIHLSPELKYVVLYSLAGHENLCEWN
jgi:hypothetical protein